MKSPQKPGSIDHKAHITRDFIGYAEQSTQDPSASRRGASDGLTILQHQRGYRFGLDALLLSTDLGAYGIANHGAHVVELGAAQGAVSLCVARQYPQLDVVAIERQQALFGLLEQNISLNGLEKRVRARQIDIREIRTGGECNQPLAHSADLVLCNPPYFKKGARRPSQNPERAAARHELHGGLGDFVDAARYILKQRGRLKIILPPIRLADLFGCLNGADLAVETIRFFHSRADDDAYLVESVLRRGGAPDMRVRAPLYIYQNADDYTDEVRRRVDGAAVPAGHVTESSL